MVTAPALMLKLGRVLGIVGADVVMAKLNEIEMESPSSFNKDIEEYVISEVCLKYNTSRNDLMKPRVQGDDLSARNLCFVLLSKHLESTSYDSIGKSFGKSFASVSTAIKDFSQMRPHIKHEREFIDAYNDLNVKVRDYKRSIETT